MGILEKLKEAISALEFQLQVAEAISTSNIAIAKEHGYVLLALAKLTAENIEKVKTEQEDG